MLTVILVVAGFLGGVVFSYLFLRANPNKKDVIDAEVNKIAGK
jgi:hypothetical protein